VALLAIVLTSGSLRVGWVMDDYFQRLAVLGSPNLSWFYSTPMEMFCFFDGDPQRNHRAMDIGIFPWWTFDRIKACFWRPLTVLTHWLDYRFWPDVAVLMHAHSLVWFGVMVFVAGLLYRRIMGAGAAAGLAVLLYAIDDAHAMSAAWLSARNALLAGCFGITAMIFHDRWRRQGRSGSAFLAPKQANITGFLA